MGLLARLEAKLDKSGGPDACWPFRGAQSRGAGRETTYGNIQEGRAGSRNWRVNRLVLLIREIRAEGFEGLERDETLVPLLHRYDRLHKGEDAAHECDWGPCGNPSHLQWKPHRVNVREQAERRRHGRVDTRITSEMLWLAEQAGRSLRDEFGCWLIGGRA